MAQLPVVLRMNGLLDRVQLCHEVYGTQVRGIYDVDSDTDDAYQGVRVCNRLADHDGRHCDHQGCDCKE